MYDRANRKPKADPRAIAVPAAPAPVQRAAAPMPYHSLPGSVGLTQPNRTGLPDGLKSGLEGLSGLSMDDVRVHRGSSRPAAIQAHAYTQGSEIHLAPGQERHLAHEAWHVVQQKQGRVAPTMQLGDTAINDDHGLEGEADRMGERAAQTGASAPQAAAPVQRAGVAAPVVQRSVLHIQNDEGDWVYYSDLEVVQRGRRLTTFPTKAAAQKFDDKLAADTDVVGSALTTSQDRDRRVPTPFGYMDSKLTAKVRHQSQGPHSLSFIAFEQRLQNRLRKGQFDELAHQVLTPDTAKALMKAEYNLDDDDGALERYVLDYTSLYGEFARRLKNDTDHGVGSAFHLVARKLLQLHPYTTYNGGKSTYQDEDRHGILGSSTIDSKSRFRNAKQYQTYLQTRGDMFHSSDEEEEGYEPQSESTPFVFTAVTPRDRRYSRKAKASGSKKRKKTPETSSSSKGVGVDTGLSSSSEEKPKKKQPKKSAKVVARDTVRFYGHDFSPNTPNIRDGGQCFWDTMRHYGFNDEQLNNAARAAGLTVDTAVEAGEIPDFIAALNKEVNETVWVRLVTYDLATLEEQDYVDMGDGDEKLYIALFNDGTDGHYVPEL